VRGKRGTFLVLSVVGWVFHGFAHISKSQNNIHFMACVKVASVDKSIAELVKLQTELEDKTRCNCRGYVLGDRIHAKKVPFVSGFYSESYRIC